MMNKEKVIDEIIERYKERENKSTPGLYDCCQKIDCADCPFYQERQGCRDAVFNELIKRLIETEERQETNFDRYIKNYCLIAYDDEVTFKLKDGWKESFCSFGAGFKEWLLAPYEKPPEPKYKLTQFEIDFIHACQDLNGAQSTLYSYIFNELQSKGHFKGVPKDAPIGKILDNCEVINDEID